MRCRFHPSDTMGMGVIASAVGRNFRSMTALHGTPEERSLQLHKDLSETLTHFTPLRGLNIAGMV